MKIDDPNAAGAISTPATTSTPGVESGGRRPGSAGVTGSGPDKAELSDLAGKISQAVGHDAARRAEKLEQLRDAVASGSYQPDAHGIGRGIVNEALAQGGTAQSSKPGSSEPGS